MPYNVKIHYSPAYELLVSLHAFHERSTQKALDLGTDWVRRVAKRLPAGFTEQIRLLEKTGVPIAMVAMAPPDCDELGFIDWLAEMPLGLLYERVLGAIPDPAKMPPDLAGVREEMLAILRTWYDSYYRTLPAEIAAGLAADARRSPAGLSPGAVVELVTNGVVLEPGPGIQEVILYPQYHFRPFNLFDWTPRQCLIGYAADVLPPVPGAVPADLRTLTRALADDSRLQILRFLAGGVRSFTEIVKFAGLAKSTVHHHMVTLRASGLVKVHVKPDGPDRYSLRLDAIDSLTPRLHGFLEEE